MIALLTNNASLACKSRLQPLFLNFNYTIPNVLLPIDYLYILRVKINLKVPFFWLCAFWRARFLPDSRRRLFVFAINRFSVYPLANQQIIFLNLMKILNISINCYFVRFVVLLPHLTYTFIVYFLFQD